MDELRTAQIRRTIINLNQQEPIRPENVTIAVTIPLSKERFENEKNGAGWWGKLFGIGKDFAKNFAGQFAEPFWEGRDKNGYLYRVALPVLKSLLYLRENSETTIIADFTYNSLENVLRDPECKLLMILAHHYHNRIEFADISKSVDSVVNLFEKPNHRMSVALFVCEAESEGLKMKDLQMIQSVASSPFEISVIHAAEFMVHWIKAMDGYRTLSDAYQEGLYNYFNSCQ